MKQLLTGALVAGTALAGLTVTAPAQADSAARPRAEVTIKVSDTTPEVGDKVRIKGTVDPAARGGTVLLQVRYENRKAWKTIGRDRLNGKGRYALKDKVGSVRERDYRVVAPAASGRPRSVSDRVAVTVFGWRSLTSIKAANYDGIGTVKEAKINAIAYPNSLVDTGYNAVTTRSIGYNLDRDCTQLRGVIGLSDTSPVNGSATVAVAGDGVTKVSQSFALTQGAPVAVDVTGVFRLTVSSTPTHGGLGAFGTPEVYCSF